MRGGSDLIAAYVAGYEVWADLISRERGNYQRKGWHPTGIFGAISAAAPDAPFCIGSTRARSAHALGIAASQSSGVMSNLGSMVKPTHPGKSAACGIVSARFAKAGVTAAADCLEHEQGFLKAISPAGEVDLERPLGKRGVIVADTRARSRDQAVSGLLPGASCDRRHARALALLQA
jgi:2-methylcitrate dehydratase PrpD